MKSHFVETLLLERYLFIYLNCWTKAASFNSYSVGKVFGKHDWKTVNPYRTAVNPFRTARVVFVPIWNDVYIPFWIHLAFSLSQ